jgi:NlpC/P60 family putative phage cell wall peptidase
MHTRQDVVDLTRSWIGTPWVHQGRRAGVGLDCVGLITSALAVLGEPTSDYTWYRRAPEGDNLLREIRARFVELPAPEPGSLLVFFIRSRRVAQHIGLLTYDGTIVHANAAAGRVCEQPYDAEWQRRTLAAFDLTRRATA